ncbi:MAG: acetyl-CoA carboxylase biotin carboxylase subunit [Anaerolineae bacterium]
MFDKVLIANRGEIAVRVIRACQELGIRTVAVFSEADRGALHVRLADEARLLGPAPARESYLSIDKVIETALATHAQAIHPGYGFLSENAEFARRVRAAGLAFIGPPPEAIRAMGDKAEARKLMQARNVPTVPGYQDLDQDAALQQAADAIGYPVLVKAAAGGGGKAMRVVNTQADLIDALGAARREARHAFGDERLIIEKYVRHARHIEFQILADAHGRTVHLFERECSVQRRHQKIIEETPSPLLDPPLRAAMGAAAVEAAQAVGYQNAGTVEFIVDPETRHFYFLEMNTRLQVEHPITELTTGLDLVHWQLRVAAGEPLGFQQGDLYQRGHAIECRVYAEDPANGFLPSTGCLLTVVEPRRPGLRIDSGIATGDEVTVHYDPLLAKVITYAETRADAIRRMQIALNDYVLLGVRTNLDFMHAVLAHPVFQAGQVTTTFVEDQMHAWQPPTGQMPPEVLIAAALSEMAAPTRIVSPATGPTGNDPYSPWTDPRYSR